MTDSSVPSRPNASADRLVALSAELLEIHAWLRTDLARLHDEVDTYFESGGFEGGGLDGGGLDGGGLDGGRPDRPRSLHAHCQTFCSALRRHHTGEDAGAFPALADRLPDLRPVLEELERDRVVIADVLLSLEVLIASLGGPPDDGSPAGPSDPVEVRRVRAELDGLSAVLESHILFEEKKILARLDELTGPTAPASLFGMTSSALE